MVTRIRQQETENQTVRRLAQKARESGVRLVRDSRDGRHYASSSSQPGLWHYVTAWSCDCKGFISHQRCMHHSALLVAYEWVLPEHTPDPIRIRPVRCADCVGLGEVQCTVGAGRSFRYDWTTCTACHGTGKAHQTERHAA